MPENLPSADGIGKARTRLKKSGQKKISKGNKKYLCPITTNPTAIQTGTSVAGDGKCRGRKLTCL